MSVEHGDKQRDADVEVARLQVQVAQLQDELAAVQAWANAVVADAERQVYWLDRLHLDLDPIMRRLPVDFARDVYRKVRGAYQSARRLAGWPVRLLRRL